MPLAAAAALAVVLVPAPAATLSTPDDRARWRAVLHWPEECELEHQRAVKLLELTEGRVRAFDLGTRRTLIEVACARGAYQDRLLFYLYDESRTPALATRLGLPGYEAVDDEWEARELSEVAGEASFETATKTLRVFTRARGLGDCGSIARYRLRGDRLALVDFRGRACDGDPESAPAPEKWPRLFPK